MVPIIKKILKKNQTTGGQNYPFTIVRTEGPVYITKKYIEIHP